MKTVSSENISNIVVAVSKNKKKLFHSEEINYIRYNKYS